MEKLNAQEKDKLLKRMRRYYRIGLRTNRDWIKRAKQGYAFYFGDQWDAADRRKCESENRPALTVNKIFPVINTVSGIKRKNKQDFKVYPFKGSNQNWAQVYTTLLKDTADDAESEWETAAMFDDGIISGKGWVGLDVDYSEDPLQGDLTLERLSPFEVLEDGRDKHYNLNKGAEFVIRLKRMTKQELQDEFPDVKLDNVSYDDLAEAYGLPDASTVETEDYPEEEAYFAEHEGEGDEEEESRKLWVKQCWWKSKEYFNLLINTTTDEVRRVTDKDGIEYAKYLVDTYPDKYDFLEHQRVNNMHVTTWIGNKLLDHRDDPLQGCCKFPLVRFCAYYMEGFNIGMVDNLVDPQQEHNKRRSQVLHHLNSTANSGWIGDDDALADWSVLEDFGSKPGIIIKKRPGKELQRIIPVPASPGHLAMSELPDSDIKDISGVNSQLQAQTPDRKISGKAIALQQEQGLTANTMLFDNYNHTKIILGKTMLDIIRKNGLYSLEEITQLIDVTEEMAKELESAPSGRFKVKVSLSPQMPTVRIANYQTLKEMIVDGVPIHPRHLIAASDVENKDEIIQDMAQMSEQGPGGNAA